MSDRASRGPIVGRGDRLMESIHPGLRGSGRVAYLPYSQPDWRPKDAAKSPTRIEIEGADPAPGPIPPDGTQEEGESTEGSLV